jgi:hypothetical protein
MSEAGELTVAMALEARERAAAARVKERMLIEVGRRRRGKS